MKIIKRGKMKELTYTVQCDDCDTHFSFLSSEGKLVVDARDGDYLIVKCPVCKEQIEVDVTLGK